MRKTLPGLIFFAIFCSSSAWATHIVGGEFELVHKKDYDYELRLIQYFDHIHGNPGAEDGVITAYIFRKSDNRYMASLNLFRRSSEFVHYTNPKCRVSGIHLQTRRIVYTSPLYLSPDTYNDPEGYYVVWERCCRNQIISNIREPDRTGQAFYLEFPPVVKKSKPFVNSSPVLFPPLSDYAVVDQLYYVDFGGTDADGDSLAYSLAVPLRGNSSPEVPIPGGIPAPYRLVSWAYGYNIDNVIPGELPLNIDSKGFITVKPDRKGLFVFSVNCEEFRNGEKIGEVRRDFQLLVVDIKVGNKPKALIKLPEFNGFYNEGEVLTFGVDDEKCFELYVTDPDENERIKVKAVPVNFSENLEGLLPVNQGIIENANDTLKFQVCLPDCSYTPGVPFMIDFVASDNSCALPLMDTVRITVLIEPEKNNKPAFIDPVTESLTALVHSDSRYELPLAGRDIDLDELRIEVTPVGFNMNDYGMSLTILKNEKGAVDAVFNFDASCEKYDFSDKNDFRLNFRLYDQGDCKESLFDELRLHIKMLFPPDHAPEVSSSLQHLTIEILPDEEVMFNVYALDEDDDMISLTGAGDDFELASHGMVFENKRGKGRLSSPFSWLASCENLKNKDLFLIHFVADDRGNCKASNYDTLSVLIRVITPENNAPVAGFDDLSHNRVQTVPGKEFEINITGFDVDDDSIVLKMENRPEYRNLNILFNEVSGRGRVVSKFKFLPDCELLSAAGEEVLLNFNFIVSDIRCLNAKADTITLVVNVEDIVYNYEEYTPHNVFTPNDDEVNDFYELTNLPPDNCYNQFLGISIFNRWGKMVYYNTRRDFRWDGKGYSTGVYYCVIRYTNKEYKGTVSILY